MSVRNVNIFSTNMAEVFLGRKQTSKEKFIDASRDTNNYDAIIRIPIWVMNIIND